MSPLRIAAIAATLLIASTVYAAPMADTVTTPSGLKYVVTHRGNGKKPKAGNLVLVHYHGKLTDGSTFDESRGRGEPFAFRLGKGQVIKGWDEGIALLRVGDKATLIIPSDLGYGEKGAGGAIPPNATLIFDVELMGVTDKTVGEQIELALNKKGAAGAWKEYAKLKKKNFKGYYFSEAEINGLGYRPLKDGRVADAIEIFKINVDAFPKSGNVYDSLGEACMMDGQKDLAVLNYKKSLELDPKNENAKEMLKKLELE